MASGSFETGEAPGDVGLRSGFCVSIDVERDYRKDSALTTRGVREGLPAFLDVLRSHGAPYDLMVSGEVVNAIPDEVVLERDRLALGCHADSHQPGYLSRLNRVSQESSVRRASVSIAEKFGRTPVHFRAPNFSANGDTIRVLTSLGYRVDSSILPGRLVRRWRLLTLVDHRNLPSDPFFVDPESYPQPGHRSILEIPVTANPVETSGPLGLGYLNAEGLPKFLGALRKAENRYVVFLAHTWEMVDWDLGDGVAPWVRDASSSRHSSFDALLSSLDNRTLINLDGILGAEGV